MVRKQLAFILARQQVFLELDDAGLEETVDLTDIMSNVLLNNNFLALAREVSGVAVNNLPPPLINGSGTLFSCHKLKFRGSNFNDFLKA